jgi:serine/threonine protein kinase
MIHFGDVSQSCDIWAFGCILYELLSPEGRQLFPNDVAVIKYALQPPPDLDIVSTVPSSVTPKCRAYIRILFRHILDVMWRNRPSGEEVLGLLDMCRSEKVLVYFTERVSEELGTIINRLESTNSFWDRVEWRRYWYIMRLNCLSELIYYCCSSRCQRVKPRVENVSFARDVDSGVVCTTQDCNGTWKFRLILEV